HLCGHPASRLAGRLGAMGGGRLRGGPGHRAIEASSWRGWAVARNRAVDDVSLRCWLPSRRLADEHAAETGATTRRRSRADRCGTESICQNGARWAGRATRREGGGGSLGGRSRGKGGG